MTGKSGTLPAVAALFVFATAFVVYAWTASPVMGWLDAPEFVAASASLGVPHSPGHPVPVLIGKLLSLLPLGDTALRVNLASSLAAAGAVTAFFVAARALLERLAPSLPKRAHAPIAAGLALGLGFTWTVWFQGVRAEVYALEGMLMMSALACLLLALMPKAASLADDDSDDSDDTDGPDDSHDDSDTDDSARPRDPRWLASAGLFVGLGLATHHFISLTVAVPATLVLLERRLRVRTAALVTSLIVLGMAAFLYLPVNS